MARTPPQNKMFADLEVQASATPRKGGAVPPQGRIEENPPEEKFNTDHSSS